MTDVELERKLLEMVFESDAPITPATVAYYTGCELARAEKLLDRLTTQGTLTIEHDDAGHIFYVYPGRTKLSRPPPAGPTPSPTATPPVPFMVVGGPQPAAPAARAIETEVAPDGTRACPYCAERILAAAKKCKHCGEMLDPAMRAAPVQVNVGVQTVAPAPVVYTAADPLQSPGIAALLSVLWPGAGQIYTGRVGAGIAWFFGVAIAYVPFVIPGLLLHILCVLNAARGARWNNQRLLRPVAVTVPPQLTAPAALVRCGACGTVQPAAETCVHCRAGLVR